MKLIAIVTLSGLVGTVSADPCADPPKKKTAVRKVVKKALPPPAPPVEKLASCECKGEKGDAGPEGPRGEPGLSVRQTKVIVQEVRARPAIDLRLGLMGTSQSPQGDWAWGPALQLATQLGPKYELALSAGLANLAIEGEESGYIVQLSVTRELRDGLGVSLGVNRASIDGNAGNGNIDGDYLGLTAGLVLRSKHFRLELGPTVGGLRDDSEVGTQFAYGVQASGFAGWSWK